MSIWWSPCHLFVWMSYYALYLIPAKFFWLKGMRFLSCEYQDVQRHHNYTCEDFRRCSEFNNSVRSSQENDYAPNGPSKMRDFGKSIVIYSFYMDFLFHVLDWVYIFLESVSVKGVIAHIFQPGVRNGFISMSWRQIKVFNLQAWELAGILSTVECLTNANKQH